ncbi:hypothetical protein AB3S75_005169 [Citrus x aurantiifolia]
MDCSDIIDSLDSLWFYSNIVVSSSRTEQSSHAVGEDAVKEAASKPVNQVEEEKESPSAENLVPRYGEFVGKEMEEFAKPAEERRKTSASSSTSASGRSRRRRRRRRKRRSLRKILGELDHHSELDFGFFDDDEETTSRQHNQVLGSEYHLCTNMKMPPLDDNMAMKEHLKSWAYAVACTVR